MGSTRRIAAAAVLAVALLAPAPREANGQAWWFGKNKVQYKEFDWRILRTPHFDIHFSEGYRDLASRAAVILEDGYIGLAEDFEHNISWRIPVILYGSHADFQQTNVTWELLPEGVQAFAEPLRKRIVLHFGGDYADFAHTAVHELIHIFEFDIIYGSLLKSVFSRGLLFRIPLWFAEGISEFYSAGYDEEVEMYMRDATVFDYLPYNLDYASGYMNYKAGQSAIHYIAETYGLRKVKEIMEHLRYQRSMELALRNTIGIGTEQLTKDWKKSLRRLYWPLYADKKEPEEFGRRLTDHIQHHHFMNTKPAFSPDGDWIVYYSDRKGLDAIYLMNALTGKVEKRLLQAQMSTQFESIKSMRSLLSFSPDGGSIAFVAKSNGRDKLFVLSVPDGGRIAVGGTDHGQTDIYVYEIGAGTLRQVTDDVEDEKEPRWFPGGDRIAYTRVRRTAVDPVFLPDSLGIERIANIDFFAPENVEHSSGDIWSVDVATGSTRELIATSGDDRSPIVLPGGEELIFVSDEEGILNLYRGSLRFGSYYRFTDVLGGIQQADYSHEKDRLVFSAFSYAGYDLFMMDSFSDKSKESWSTGNSIVASGTEDEETAASFLPRSGPDAAPETGDVDVARAVPDNDGVPGSPDTAVVAEPDTVSWPSVPGPGAVDERIAKRLRFTGVVRGGLPFDPPDAPGDRRIWPAVSVDEDSEKDIDPDTLEAIRERMRSQVGTVQPYHLKFKPDYIGNGMGLFFSTGYGFGLMNQIAFSDLMGDHHIYVAFNIYRSLEDSDMMLAYHYLRKRIDYSFGIFQFKNYLNSRISSIGETFYDYRYFTERNYGAFGSASFPFSTFTRLDLELQAYISEREFFDYYAYDPSSVSGYVYVPGEKSTRRLVQPALTLVHDSAYFGSFGPVIGTRYMLSVSRGLSFSGDDVSRTTAFADYRKYLPLFYRNYLAFRAIGSVSTGEDRRFFFLGGPLTMRGYDYLQFQGPRMMLFNLEYRYPLIDALVFGWPAQWALTNVGGTLFLDSGAVWGEGRYVEPLPSGIEPTTINDIDFYSDFGIGLYMRLGWLIMNFQFGWPTDFNRTGGSVFHFYLGPQF